MKEKNGQDKLLLLSSLDFDVSKYDSSFLNKTLDKRMSENKCNSAEDYCIILKKNKEEAQNLFDSLNISYSEFFRNSLTYSVLEQIILPSIALKMKRTRRKEIRIWSSACASGQESYSLGILMEEIKNDVKEKIDYRIFASDKSQRHISEAQKGEYSSESLNNLNLHRLNRWFTKDGEIYKVNPELKRNIDFSVFDLFNERLSCPPSSIFGDFDLVMCANLFFYYKTDFRQRLLDKTAASMTNDGYFITGETERDILIRNNYHEVFPYSAIFRRKGNNTKKYNIDNRI